MAERLVAVGALCALLLLPLACSGDEDGAEEQAAAVEEFKGELGTVSERYGQRVAEVQSSGQAALGQGGEAVLGVYRELRDAAAATDEELEDLEVPPHLRPRIAGLRENLNRQVSALDTLLAAAEAGDDAAVTGALQELAALLVDFTNARHALDQELAQGP